MADLLEQVINHPGFWVAVCCIVIYYIIREHNKGKLKPEQKPDFGRKYRAARTKEFLDKRQKAFGFKPDKKTVIYLGYRCLGRVIKTDYINITEKLDKGKTDEHIIQVITYRRFGFFNWLQNYMLSMGRCNILVDEESITEGEEKTKGGRYNVIAIPANAFFRERGGILFLSKTAHKVFIDNINSDADYENAMGFVSDFPRRLSNLHPAHAAKTDEMELTEELEAKSRDRKIGWLRRGG